MKELNKMTLDELRQLARVNEISTKGVNKANLLATLTKLEEAGELITEKGEEPNEVKTEEVKTEAPKEAEKPKVKGFAPEKGEEKFYHLSYHVGETHKVNLDTMEVEETGVTPNIIRVSPKNIHNILKHAKQSHIKNILYSPLGVEDVAKLKEMYKNNLK